MKPDRDDPCPCGGDKKYKQCCLAKSLAHANSDERAEKFKRIADVNTVASMQIQSDWSLPGLPF